MLSCGASGVQEKWSPVGAVVTKLSRWAWSCEILPSVKAGWASGTGSSVQCWVLVETVVSFLYLFCDAGYVAAAQFFSALGSSGNLNQLELVSVVSAENFDIS